MTAPVTLLTLMTRVRQRANIENATQFITDAELIDSINQATANWYDRVRLTTWGGSTYYQSVSLQTTSGVSSYALPLNWLSIDSVDVFLTPGASNQVISARPYQKESRNIFRQYGLTWAYAYPIWYRVEGQNLTFIPVPTGQYNVTLNYIPTAPVLVSATDTLDSINGWDEAIVLQAAIRCATKEENYELIPALQAQLAGEWARIDQAAAARDVGEAEVVHDVTSLGGSLGGGGGDLF